MPSKSRISKGINRRTFVRQAGSIMLGSALGSALSGGLTIGRHQSQAAEDVDEKIDAKKLRAAIEFLENEHKSEAFPGAAIIASHNGKVFFEHYTGTYRNGLGEEKPYHPDVRCVFYSFTKGISATVVMMAHQEGLIDIDETIASYIPEFAQNGKDKITLRQVLTHSAGIPNAPTPFKSLRNEQEWVAAIDAVCEAKLEWAPGSQTAYHGLGMMIPAEVVRRKSDRRTWNSICRERLFDPMGAKTLTFELPDDPSLVNTAPLDSNRQDGAQKLLAGHPAGGCYGTLSDGLRILQLHLNKGSIEGRELLRPSVFKEMHTIQYAKEIAEAASSGKAPKHENWAVGWLLRGEGPPHGGTGWFGFKDQPNAKIFGHAGIDTLIGVADPDKGVALMFNMTRSPKSPEETVRLRNEATNRILAAVA